MYGERNRAEMHEKHLSASLFSIFYCGCKQPKSIHILFSGAKLRKIERRTKEFVLFYAEMK